MWDPRADAWLAGFADGEATFLLNHHSQPTTGRPGIYPRFSVNLRADDVGVLRQLERAFGGRTMFDPKRGGVSPRFFWYVSSKADLPGLVEYFDRFPLRAKKARDCAIWREAAIIYAARGGVEPYAELVALRDALIAGRRFMQETHLSAAERALVAMAADN